MTDQIQIEHENGVTRILLNRPTTGNGITGDMIDAMASAVTDGIASDESRLIVISAAGPSFSGGAEVSELLADDLAQGVDQWLAKYHALLELLYAVPVPVVVVARGMVSGSAIGLLGVADFVLAEDTLQFVTGSIRVGMISDGGALWFLTRRLGARRAMELGVLSPVVDADRALELGLVTSVVAADQLESAQSALERRLMRPDRHAVTRSKALIRQADADLATYLRAERAAAIECAREPSTAEGLAKLVSDAPSS